jgi:hypothetical protein
MHTQANQKDIDQRIHEFRASKSPWKTVSKTIASYLAPSSRLNRSGDTEISYERTDWNHGGLLSHGRMQKVQ